MILGILTHIMASTAIAMLSGLIFGRVSLAIAIFSLVVGTLAGIWAWLTTSLRGTITYPRLSFLSVTLYIFILLIAYEHFLYLLFQDGALIKTSHANNFGDLSLHIQYIRHIASGEKFWPFNPGFAGLKLKYPFGMDLYSSLWEVIGLPLDTQLFVVGLTLTVACLCLLHWWMNWWGVGIFFLNGGLANFEFLSNLHLKDVQNSVAWKNFFVSLWITQRGFLFAIPAGIFVLKTMIDFVLEERRPSQFEKWLAVFMWLSLAWFHLHSFFLITIFLLLLFLLRGKLHQVFWPLTFIAVCSFAFIVFSTDRFAKAGVIHFQWGWMADLQPLNESSFGNLLTSMLQNAMRLTSFWFYNLGPWLICLLVALVCLVLPAARRYRLITLIVICLGLVFSNVMLAPWDWDNIKVLLWVYLLLSWAIWEIYLARLASFITCGVAVLVFFSGTISLLASFPRGSTTSAIYNVAQLAEAKVALAQLPKGSVVAVAPEPNHPFMYWGTQLAMGYTGHMWSHGINYRQREQKISRIYSGDPEWQSLAQQEGITHICWGSKEKEKYSRPAEVPRSETPEASTPSQPEIVLPWRQSQRNISLSRQIEVYEVKSP